MSEKLPHCRAIFVTILGYFRTKGFLNRKLSLAQLHVLAITRDLEHEMDENMRVQFEADVFMRALNSTFTEQEISRFFDYSDKIREEHENVKTNSG